MAYQRAQAAEIWRLVGRQHGVVSRAQLIGLGVSGQAIKRRLASGRLHRTYRGVYVVGRPELSREGRRMAAVLACGPGAVVSHASAGALWRILADRLGPFEVSVPAPRCRRVPGIRVHRRRALTDADTTIRNFVPVTAVVRTVLDLAATGVAAAVLDRVVNEADRLDLIDPDGLRAALDDHAREPGVGRLRSLLDRATFTLTESELERAFLRYHRTPAQQARNRRRDQAHAASGLTPLRFTHAQVKFDPGYVKATLVAVVRRITSFG
jgi:hypothetical protein